MLTRRELLVLAGSAVVLARCVSNRHVEFDITVVVMGPGPNGTMVRIPNRLVSFTAVKVDRNGSIDSDSELTGGRSTDVLGEAHLLFGYNIPYSGMYEQIVRLTLSASGGATEVRSIGLPPEFSEGLWFQTINYFVTG